MKRKYRKKGVKCKRGEEYLSLRLEAESNASVDGVLPLKVKDLCASSSLSTISKLTEPPRSLWI